MSSSVVCFDIGGVLVKIRHSWDQAVIASGYPPLPSHEVGLNSFPGLLALQESQLDDDAYFSDLGEWLGLDANAASQVHRSILDSDYPGAEDLIRELKSKGVFTCCFSNTNGLHWRYLIDPKFHPAIAELDLRIASHEIRAAKPELSAFDLVDKMLPTHEQVIFFDDTSMNVTAAREFGWKSFLIDPSQDSVEQMREQLKTLGILSQI